MNVLTDKGWLIVQHYSQEYVRGHIVIRTGNHVVIQTEVGRFEGEIVRDMRGKNCVVCHAPAIDFCWGKPVCPLHRHIGRFINAF